MPVVPSPALRKALSCSIFSYRNPQIIAMVAGSIGRDYLSPVSPNRIWKAVIFDAHNLIPKLLPDFISSVEILEGDGGVGTIKQLNATEAVTEFRFIKEKTDILDNEKHRVKQSIIEGGLIGLLLKSYSVELKLEEDTDGGTLGKIIVEYETLGDTPLSSEEEEKIMEGVYLVIKTIDQYLLANPTAYV
ncbi:Pathogenesis-related protein 1 [Apostasia shenzhenica]|uniref:Pathogenesis-related protein 1 n=1 Tax=Apostasia shenzhenica TaxID=1088818 RepID=A0A2I0B369_9ASPA|nr:Pathogenesis-related protein 1 [Apostasia shenzhenica]